MKKFVCLLLVLSVLFVPFTNNGSALAGEVDILIEKLVEKGVLSPSDAEDLVREIQKESEKEKAEVKEVASETAKEVVKEEKQKGGFEMPQWVKDIKPFGDLRLRHDTQWKDKDSGSDTRNRERFRLRFGVKTEVYKNTEVGIRLASGSGFQNTTNQSYDDHGRGKNVFIDRAYAKWKANENFTIVGGKHKNPLFTTPLVWESDVQPEGFAETFNFGITDNVSLYANFGQWFIEEIKAKNSDPTQLSFQMGTEIKPTKDFSLNFAATYHSFLNMDRISFDVDDIDDKETFIGYNNASGQQMVFDNDGQLVNEWGCLELILEAKFKNFLPLPFSIFANYIQNLDADTDELIRKGVAYPDTNPADLLAYGGDDRDMGWLVGVDFGNKKKKGDLYFKYWYQVLEDYAFPAVYVDSDFHNGGTNNKGHKIHARYLFTDRISARATGYLTERDDERKDGKFDEDRIQLDVVFAYP